MRGGSAPPLKPPSENTYRPRDMQPFKLVIRWWYWHGNRTNSGPRRRKQGQAPRPIGTEYIEKPRWNRAIRHLRGLACQPRRIAGQRTV